MASHPDQENLNFSSQEMEEIANSHLDSQKKKSVSSQVYIYLCERISQENFTTKSLCEEMGIIDEKEMNAVSAALSKLASHKHKVLKAVAKTAPHKNVKGGRGSFIYKILDIKQMPNYKQYASKGGTPGRKIENKAKYPNLPLSDQFMMSTSMNASPIKSFADLKGVVVDSSFNKKDNKSVTIKNTTPPFDENQEKDELSEVETTIEILKLLKSTSSGEIADAAQMLINVAEAQSRMMELIKKSSDDINNALRLAALSLKNVSNLKIEISNLDVDQLLKALRSKFRSQEGLKP